MFVGCALISGLCECQCLLLCRIVYYPCFSSRMWSHASVCLCVRGYESLSHVSLSLSECVCLSVCVNDVSAYVRVGVCVSAQVCVCRVCLSASGNVSMGVCVSPHQGLSVSRGLVPQCRVPRSGGMPVCILPCVPGCACPCLRGWLSVAKRPWVGECVPQRVPASACVCLCPCGRLSVAGRPRVSVGMCAPAGAQGFTL